MNRLPALTIVFAVACGSSAESADGLAPPESVGRSCTPSVESSPAFGGFALAEVSVEIGSCEGAVCIVNHFQGRVSCPYGQRDSGTECETPNGGEPVTVPVPPQLVARQAEEAVYCSCRCNGPDADATYCDCPSRYECVDLIPSLGVGPAGIAGSYCVKRGTAYDLAETSVEPCDATRASCG